MKCELDRNGNEMTIEPDDFWLKNFRCQGAFSFVIPYKPLCVCLFLLLLMQWLVAESK